ncbi:hypothetical protein FKM82_019010 [Ascaphus truei]
MMPERVRISKHVGHLPPTHKQVGIGGGKRGPHSCPTCLEIKLLIKEKVIMDKCESNTVQDKGYMCWRESGVSVQEKFCSCETVLVLNNIIQRSHI